MSRRSAPPLDALICSQKVAFRWHYEAEDFAERHIDCRKCGPGRRLRAYRCPVDPSHFHCGHEYAS